MKLTHEDFVVLVAAVVWVAALWFFAHSLTEDRIEPIEIQQAEWSENERCLILHGKSC